MCIPISTPNHIKLVSSCYPAVPLAASPDFKPNSQELSRLTYYASNRPGKLTKLGLELEKRAHSDSRRAAGGNAKSRALLLITLSILKALTAECRKDVSLFARSVVVSIGFALSALPLDLEVTARAASVFTAYTTYSHGNASGVDESLLDSYLLVLTKFANLSTFSGKSGDPEVQNRTRLVGLAALTGAVNSDVLYCSPEATKKQVGIIVPPLLLTVQKAGVSVLREQEIALEESQSTSSPYLAEFQPSRPIAQRRAASIHIHVDGEKGPSSNDVIYAALRAMKSLLGRSDASGVGNFLQAMFDTLDAEGDWDDVDLCCWIALTVTEWTQYQYRYAVPVRLIEKLVDGEGAPRPTRVHSSLVAMITSVFSSPTPIANLSTSDVLSNLVRVILRRVSIDVHDGLLPSLVECVASLGTHLYYADQVQDLAEELINRLIGVQVNGLLGRGRSGNEEGRVEGMRCLLACLTGLSQVAVQREETLGGASHHFATPKKDNGYSGPNEKGKGKSVTNDVQNVDEPAQKLGGKGGAAHSRRHPIPAELWQETLAILCESDYSIRAGYARSLVLFLKREFPKESWVAEAAGAEESRRNRITLNGTLSSGTDETTRFLHAMNASAFTLAVSPALGLSTSTPPSVSPSHRSSSQALVNGTNGTSGPSSAETAPATQINVIPPTPMNTPMAEVALAVTTAAQSLRPEPKRGSTGRPRTSSLALSLLDPPPSQLVSPAPAPATPSDYSHLVMILTTAYEVTPARAVLAGVPMLLALDSVAQSELAQGDESVKARRQAVRQLVAEIWGVIGQIFELQEVRDAAEKALGSLPQPSVLPELPPAHHDLLHPPEVSLEFVLNIELSDGAASHPLIDPDVILPALASSGKLQTATGLDRHAILRRLTAEWSTEIALRESVEKSPTHETAHRENVTPFLRISPALMRIDNQSLASLSRPGRGVDVGDLREALEGRGNRSSPGLGTYTPSVSSVGHTSAPMREASSHEHTSGATLYPPTNGNIGPLKKILKGNSPADVKDVLNRLGIGKNSSGGDGLRTPLPADSRPKKSSTLAA